MKRVVVDTSSLIGAMLRTQSTPARMFQYVLRHTQFFASISTLGELTNVAQRKAFDKNVPLADRLQFLATYNQHVHLVDPLVRVTDCRDPKDNPFLELALHIRADALITSDDDLLALHPWRAIPIVTPGDFLSAVN